MNSINQSIGQLGVTNNIGSQPIKTSLNKQEYDERYFRQRYIDVIQKIANEWSKSSMLIEDRYYKIQFSEPDFKLKDIDSRYFNERVTYFTREGLEDRQVFAINGLLINYDLKKYNTTKRLDAADGDGEMIVMDRLGSLFIAPKERGVFHHSSFFSGKPVAYAALCEIKEGKIINKVRYSGHYTPGTSEESSFEIQIKTYYLKLEPIFSSLKLDKEGNLVQAISISSKQKAEELYDIIAKIGGFARSKLQLMCNGLILPSEVIGETKLKSGCRIQALESSLTRYDRIYPQGLFELTINEPENVIKPSVETDKKIDPMILISSAIQVAPFAGRLVAYETNSYLSGNAYSIDPKSKTKFSYILPEKQQFIGQQEGYMMRRLIGLNRLQERCGLIDLTLKMRPFSMRLATEVEANKIKELIDSKQVEFDYPHVNHEGWIRIIKNHISLLS